MVVRSWRSRAVAGNVMVPPLVGQVEGEGGRRETTPIGTTRGRRHDRRYGPYEAAGCIGPVRPLRRPGVRARRAPWRGRASVLRTPRAAARRGAGAHRRRDPGRDRPSVVRQRRGPQPLRNANRSRGTRTIPRTLARVSQAATDTEAVGP